MTDAIQSSTSTGAIGAATNDAIPNLTPEALLAYCSSRLGAIDDVIKGRFAEQKKRNEAMKEYGALMNIVARNPDGQHEHAEGNEPWHQAQGADLLKLYNQTEDPHVRDKIVESYRTITGNDLKPGPDGKAIELESKDVKLEPNNISGFSAPAWQEKVDLIKSAEDDLSKDNEMSMIELQSMISQRQLAVQLTTQMMSAMNEGQKGVIANIRG